MAAPSTSSYFKVDSVDSQTAALATPPSQHERYFANAKDGISPEEEAALSATEIDSESDESPGENPSNGDIVNGSAKSHRFKRAIQKVHEMQRQPPHNRIAASAATVGPTRASLTQSSSMHPRTMKHKKLSTQRSILKNSIERSASYIEEQEILEAKKQLILRRRRLFSHYRQYEQWRRRQFSYDPSYFRANPLPIGQAACGDYYSNFSAGSSAFRRRSQFRKQYSCAERTREDSRDSRDSSAMQKHHSLVASDTINSSDTSMLQHQQQQQRQHRILAGHQFERISHFHMLQEERSTSISERCTRSRINSAIFVSSEGRGFDSIEFLRRHGSQSVLCRKARSAENITDNARKKSFSEQRHWRTDEEPAKRNSNDNNVGELELKEIRPNNEIRRPSALNTNLDVSTTKVAAPMASKATAAVTTAANVIVGSISIEAPPSNLFEDSSSLKSAQMVARQHASIGSTTSASHGSTDTVEELIPIPLAVPTTSTPATTTTTSVAATTTILPIQLVGPSERKSLVRQRSSTTSSSPRSISPSTNPKPLCLKGIKPKVMSNLPMVSVSGPSPQEEKPEGL